MGLVATRRRPFQVDRPGVAPVGRVMNSTHSETSVPPLQILMIEDSISFAKLTIAQLANTFPLPHEMRHFDNENEQAKQQSVNASPISENAELNRGFFLIDFA